MQFSKGDRVCTLVDKSKYKGKVGRIYFIHSIEEVYVEFDSDCLRVNEAQLSDAIKLEDLTLIPPIFSGYLYVYNSTSPTWTKKYVEVWDTHVSVRLDEQTYELSNLVKFNKHVCKILDTSVSRKYPFLTTPPMCKNTNSQLMALEYDKAVLYIAGEDAADVRELKAAVLKGIKVCADMRY